MKVVLRLKWAGTARKQRSEEAAIAAAETFYSCGREQHLSETLSKGAVGSDRREKLRAPAPVAESMPPASAR